MVVKKKTMESEQRAWASVISMRARKVSLFVSPHQSLLSPFMTTIRTTHRWSATSGFPRRVKTCTLPHQHGRSKPSRRASGAFSKYTAAVLDRG